jgi:hypothetical protein
VVFLKVSDKAVVARTHIHLFVSTSFLLAGLTIGRLLFKLSLVIKHDILSDIESCNSLPLVVNPRRP